MTYLYSLLAYFFSTAESMAYHCMLPKVQRMSDLYGRPIAQIWNINFSTFAQIRLVHYITHVLHVNKGHAVTLNRVNKRSR